MSFYASLPPQESPTHAGDPAERAEDGEPHLYIRTGDAEPQVAQPSEPSTEPASGQQSLPVEPNRDEVSIDEYFAALMERVRQELQEERGTRGDPSAVQSSEGPPEGASLSFFGDAPSHTAQPVRFQALPAETAPPETKPVREVLRELANQSAREALHAHSTTRLRSVRRKLFATLAACGVALLAVELLPLDRPLYALLAIVGVLVAGGYGIAFLRGVPEQHAKDTPSAASGDLRNKCSSDM